MQTGPNDGPIQFVVEIPDETERGDVVAVWVLTHGVPVNDETDGIGFADEWPEEVRQLFDAGGGQRWSWASLS